MHVQKIKHAQILLRNWDIPFHTHKCVHKCVTPVGRVTFLHNNGPGIDSFHIVFYFKTSGLKNLKYTPVILGGPSPKISCLGFLMMALTHQKLLDPK